MNRFREWYRSRAGDSRPMILAHRGDSFRAPENTLEAARLGLAAGADGWELDVRLTSDGHPVVIHDESLLRTTNVAERFPADDRRHSGFRVSDFTRAEIQSLKRRPLVRREDFRTALSARIRLDRPDQAGRPRPLSFGFGQSPDSARGAGVDPG